MSALFDPGLQPERTELAWRRTALSLGVGSLVAMRLLPEVLGDVLWALVGVGGLMLAAALWVAARWRLRAANRSLLSGVGALPDGRMLLGVVLAVLLIGLASAVVVALFWVSTKR